MGDFKNNKTIEDSLIVELIAKKNEKKFTVKAKTKLSRVKAIADDTTYYEENFNSNKLVLNEKYNHNQKAWLIIDYEQMGFSMVIINSFS
jgi:hypothetical protein